MYTEYRPHSLLEQYVETYWAYSGLFTQEGMTRILPAGCVDIVFILNDGQNNGKNYIPGIVGTRTSFIEIGFLGEIKLVGIRFKPGGITAFTKIPINEFTNLLADIDLCETIFDKSFHESIEEKSIEDIMLFFDEYLLQRLPSIFEVDNRINYAVSLIKENRGDIEIPNIAEQTCLSDRQFERRFKSSIGISAKTFSRIIKLRNTIHFIKMNPSLSLFEIAINCGYYDHAHLIKEFKSLSGYSPSDLSSMEISLRTIQ